MIAFNDSSIHECTRGLALAGLPDPRPMKNQYSSPAIRNIPPIKQYIREASNLQIRNFITATLLSKTNRIFLKVPQEILSVS